MNKRPLTHVVRYHLQAQELNPRQLERLEQLQSEAMQPHLTTKARWNWAAAIILAVVASLSALLLTKGQDHAAIAQLMAEEIAMNHLKNRPLEVKGSQVASLRDYFTELDFVLSESTRLAGTTTRLLGGRYCSIQGVGAAQLRLQEENQGYRTWYQVPFDHAKHAVLQNIDRDAAPIVRYARGVRVEMWAEKGLVFALAGDAIEPRP